MIINNMLYIFYAQTTYSNDYGHIVIIDLNGDHRDQAHTFYSSKCIRPKQRSRQSTPYSLLG